MGICILVVETKIATIKIPQSWGGLKKHGFGGWVTVVMVSSKFFSSWSLSPWLADEHLLALYGVFPLSPCILGISLYFLISSYKNPGHIELGPVLTASFNLITSLKAMSQIWSHSEIVSIRAWTGIYWGWHSSVCNSARTSDLFKLLVIWEFHF